MNFIILGQVAAFTFISIVTFFFVFKRAKAVYRNINLGKSVDVSGHFATRFKNMVLIALGQKKCSKIHCLPLCTW